MASYNPPSNGYYPDSSVYNPSNYVTIDTNSSGNVSTDQSNTFTALQYCSATQPDVTDNSTIIPNTSWVQSAIDSNILPNLYAPLIYIIPNNNTTRTTFTFTLPASTAFPPPLGYTFDWYFTPATTCPMYAYINSTQTSDWFELDQVGYSFGTTPTNPSPVNLKLYSVRGYGIAGMIINVSNGKQYVAYEWNTTNSIGTNSFTITPSAQMVNNVYTYQVTFTASSGSLYGAQLTIFPKVI